MPSLNTFASYVFRAVLGLQLAGLWALSKSNFGNPSIDAKQGFAFEVSSGLLIVLLLFIWTTRKNPARRYAKLVDSILGAGWILLLGALVLRSLSMGTI